MKEWTSANKQLDWMMGKYVIKYPIGAGFVYVINALEICSREKITQYKQK